MAPFDSSFVEDDSASDILDSAAVTCQSAVLNGSFVAATVKTDATETFARRAYPLAEHTRLVTSEVDADAYAGSLRTNSYAEYLLQVLDKNATMTSIFFILAYAGILHSL